MPTHPKSLFLYFLDNNWLILPNLIKKNKIHKNINRYLSIIYVTFKERFKKIHNFFLKYQLAWATIHGVDDKEVSDKGFETLLKKIEQGFKDEAY